MWKNWYLFILLKSFCSSWIHMAEVYIIKLKPLILIKYKRSFSLLPLLSKCTIPMKQTISWNGHSCLPNSFYGPCGRCQTESQAAVYKRRFSSPFWLLFENGIFAFHCTTHLSTRPSLKNYKSVRNLLSIFKVMRKYFDSFGLYQLKCSRLIWKKHII